MNHSLFTYKQKFCFIFSLLLLSSSFIISEENKQEEVYQHKNTAHIKNFLLGTAAGCLTPFFLPAIVIGNKSMNDKGIGTFIVSLILSGMGAGGICIFYDRLTTNSEIAEQSKKIEKYTDLLNIAMSSDNMLPNQAATMKKLQNKLRWSQENKDQLLFKEESKCLCFWAGATTGIIAWATLLLLLACQPNVLESTNN